MNDFHGGVAILGGNKMAEVVYLIIDNGSLVRLECKSKDTDQFHESIENAVKLRGWWCPGMLGECTANYLGYYLDRVNMARVVGMV